MRLSAPRTLAFALATLALTGCIVPGDSDEPIQSRQAPAERSFTEGPDGYLHGLREYHWATDETLGQVSLRFPLHFTQAANCEFSYAGNIYVDDAGGELFLNVVEQNGETLQWSAYSWQGLVSVYARGIDQRSILLSESVQSYVGIVRRRLEGDITFTHLARAAFPDKNGYAPGYGLAISLVCDAPFDIVGAMRGEEATLLNLNNLNGTGAIAHTVGSAVVDATASALITGAVAGFYMANFGLQSGQVELRHPGGLETWPLSQDSPSFYQVAAGPGGYDLTMTRVGIAENFQSAWLMAVYGLVRPLDLANGRHEQSVITSGN